MDAGYMDEEGYLYVMSRVDDVINVAGHRISAGAIEEVLINNVTVFQAVSRNNAEIMPKNY
jgi:propionyl-CoA synthetase